MGEKNQVVWPSHLRPSAVAGPWRFTPRRLANSAAPIAPVGVRTATAVSMHQSAPPAGSSQEALNLASAVCVLQVRVEEVEEKTEKDDAAARRKRIRKEMLSTEAVRNRIPEARLGEENVSSSNHVADAMLSLSQPRSATPSAGAVRSKERVGKQPVKSQGGSTRGGFVGKLLRGKATQKVASPRTGPVALTAGPAPLPRSQSRLSTPVGVIQVQPEKRQEVVSQGSDLLSAAHKLFKPGATLSMGDLRTIETQQDELVNSVSPANEFWAAVLEESSDHLERVVRTLVRTAVKVTLRNHIPRMLQTLDRALQQREYQQFHSEHARSSRQPSPVEESSSGAPRRDPLFPPIDQKNYTKEEEKEQTQEQAGSAGQPAMEMEEAAAPAKRGRGGGLELRPSVMSAPHHQLMPDLVVGRAGFAAPMSSAAAVSAESARRKGRVVAGGDPAAPGAGSSRDSAATGASALSGRWIGGGRGPVGRDNAPLPGGVLAGAGILPAGMPSAASGERQAAETTPRSAAKSTEGRGDAIVDSSKGYTKPDQLIISSEPQPPSRAPKPAASPLKQRRARRAMRLSGAKKTAAHLPAMSQDLVARLRSVFSAAQVSDLLHAGTRFTEAAVERRREQARKRVRAKHSRGSGAASDLRSEVHSVNFAPTPDVIPAAEKDEEAEVAHARARGCADSAAAGVDERADGTGPAAGSEDQILDGGEREARWVSLSPPPLDADMPDCETYLSPLLRRVLLNSDAAGMPSRNSPRKENLRKREKVTARVDEELGHHTRVCAARPRIVRAAADPRTVPANGPPAESAHPGPERGPHPPSGGRAEAADERKAVSGLARRVMTQQRELPNNTGSSAVGRCGTDAMPSLNFQRPVTDLTNTLDSGTVVPPMPSGDVGGMIVGPCDAPASPGHAVSIAPSNAHAQTLVRIDARHSHDMPNIHKGNANFGVRSGGASDLAVGHAPHIPIGASSDAELEAKGGVGASGGVHHPVHGLTSTQGGGGVPTTSIGCGDVSDLAVGDAPPPRVKEGPLPPSTRAARPGVRPSSGAHRMPSGSADLGIRGVGGSAGVRSPIRGAGGAQPCTIRAAADPVDPHDALTSVLSAANAHLEPHPPSSGCTETRGERVAVKDAVQKTTDQLSELQGADTAGGVMRPAEREDPSQGLRCASENTKVPAGVQRQTPPSVETVIGDAGDAQAVVGMDSDHRRNAEQPTAPTRQVAEGPMDESQHLLEPEMLGYIASAHSLLGIPAAVVPLHATRALPSASEAAAPPGVDGHTQADAVVARTENAPETRTRPPRPLLGACTRSPRKRAAASSKMAQTLAAFFRANRKSAAPGRGGLQLSVPSPRINPDWKKRLRPRRRRRRRRKKADGLKRKSRAPEPKPAPPVVDRTALLRDLRSDMRAVVRMGRKLRRRSQRRERTSQRREKRQTEPEEQDEDEDDVLFTEEATSDEDDLTDDQGEVEDDRDAYNRAVGRVSAVSPPPDLPGVNAFVHMWMGLGQQFAEFDDSFARLAADVQAAESLPRTSMVMERMEAERKRRLEEAVEGARIAKAHAPPDPTPFITVPPPPREVGGYVRAVAGKLLPHRHQPVFTAPKPVSPRRKTPQAPQTEKS